MRALTATQDVDTMRSAVFFDGPDAGRKTSRFWVLLVLAGIIAAAGVVADSTATVIGAMIVAPLMVPIQGTMLAVVLGDRANLARCLGLVVAGAVAAIAIGYLVGIIVVNDVVADTNAQVAARVTPRLIDLLAALATGVVGSVALARRDIADTLPGVAIAISLVPPLSVVGLTLQAGEVDQVFGALLLFLTNVAAILATGTVVMALYRVHLVTGPAQRAVSRRRAVVAIVALLAVVTVPLTISSLKIIDDTSDEADVQSAGRDWADTVGWELVGVYTADGRTVARFEGPLPVPDTGRLETALRSRGLPPKEVRVDFVPRETKDLEDD